MSENDKTTTMSDSNLITTGFDGTGVMTETELPIQQEIVFREGVLLDPQVVDDEKRIVRAKITTKNLDRYNSVVLPEGARLENYVRNPTVLWNHNPYFVVGRALELEVTREYIEAEWQFVSENIRDQLVQDLWTLMKERFLRGYSVGFMPVRVSFEEDDKIFEEQSGPTYLEWDLVEFSLTPIPANPDALGKNSLARRAWQSIMRRDPRTPWFENVTVPILTKEPSDDWGKKEFEPHKYITVAGKEMKEDMGEEVKPDGKVGIGFAPRQELHIGDNTAIEARAVVPYQNLPLADRGMAWDAAGAKKRVAKWAGYDGSDKDTVKWSKYKKAFVMFDRGNSEEFQGYKLPIGDIVNGSLKAVPRGVFAAAVVLQGGRGGLNEFDDGDIERSKRHVAKYYHKMGEKAPWEREEDSFEWLPEEQEFIDALEAKNTGDNMDLEELQGLVEQFRDNLESLSGFQEELREAVKTLKQLPEAIRQALTEREQPSEETPEAEEPQETTEDVEELKAENEKLKKEVGELEGYKEAFERTERVLKRVLEKIQEQEK